MAKIIGNPTVTPINTYTKKEIDDKIADIQVGGSGSNEPFIIEFDDVFSHRGNKDFYEIIVALEAKRRICVLMKSTGVIHEVGAIARGATVIGLEICGTYKVYLECSYTNKWTYNVMPLATEKYVDDKIANIQTGEGGNIAIDNAMSDTSENAVQNKVVKAYIDERSSFIVNVVIDEELNVDEEFNVTADKTYNDIVSAYNKGKRVVLMVDDRYGQGQACISNIHITSGYCEFSGVTQGMYVRFECYPNNNKWSVRAFELSDTAYLKAYIDAKFVPFTITINSDNVGNRRYLDIVRAIDSRETINIYHEMSGITWDVIGIQKQADRVLIGCHFDYTTLWLWCTSENEWGALSKEYASKSDIGDIDTALDTIIEIQNTLIGGDGE